MAKSTYEFEIKCPICERAFPIKIEVLDEGETVIAEILLKFVCQCGAQSEHSIESEQEKEIAL